MRCCICDEIISDAYGHNAQPLADGLCCDLCNAAVIAKRWEQHVYAKHKRQTQVIFTAKEERHENH